MPDLPTGSVTFLFTDIEGSTRLLEQHPRAYGAALRRHDAILRAAVGAHRGRVFETVGDAVYAAFARPADAIAAALRGQRGLVAEPWGELGTLKARMALHTGTVEQRGRHYFGPPLYRCARILALVHGGQVVLSAATAGGVNASAPDAIPAGAGLLDLGEQRLRDMAAPERLYQLVHPDLPRHFPPLRTLSPSPASGTARNGREARWRLLVRDASGLARVVPLTEAEMVIGREPACALWIESPYASRRHARIELRSDGPWYFDLGSHNGSMINGRRATRPMPLRNGDVVTIGDITLECRDEFPPMSETRTFAPAGSTGSTGLAAPAEPSGPIEPKGPAPPEPAAR